MVYVNISCAYGPFVSDMGTGHSSSCPAERMGARSFCHVHCGHLTIYALVYSLKMQRHEHCLYATVYYMSAYVRMELYTTIGNFSVIQAHFPHIIQFMPMFLAAFRLHSRAKHEACGHLRDVPAWQSTASTGTFDGSQAESQLRSRNVCFHLVKSICCFPLLVF